MTWPGPLGRWWLRPRGRPLRLRLSEAGVPVSPEPVPPETGTADAPKNRTA